MTLSPALIEIYASGGPKDFTYETMSLWHPLFSQPWNIVNNPYALDTFIEGGASIHYEPYAFTASMAGTGESGNQDLEIAISNVDRRPILEIERAAENPTQLIQLTYRVYIANNLTGPAYVVDGLTIAEVSVGENQILARASASDLLNRVFPTRLYTTTLFPGLYHV